jgi:hypothetical protein
MFWFIAGIVVCIASIIGGVIAWKRTRRVLGGLLIAFGLFIILAPLPTLRVTVELPPVAQH